MAKDTAKIKFQAETQQFDAAIKASTDEMSALKAEMKLAEAQFRNSGDATELNAQKNEILQKELEANAQKQEALNAKIETATEIYGEDSAEVQKLQTSLTYAQIQEENIKNAIAQTNDALSDQSGETNDASASLQQISDIQAAEFMQELADKAMDAAKAMYEFANEASEVEDTIDKMSQRLGMSYDAYQTWEYILSQAGVEITSMRTGFKTLTNTIGKVTEAGTTAGTAFGALGISMEDIKGKSQEEIFAQTIYALQDVDDQTKKATLAQKLFGRSGQEMIPLLNQSKESTEALAKKAHELGIVLGDEAVAQGVEYHDTIDTLDRSINSIKTSLGTALMPAIQGVVDVVQPIAPVINNITQKISEIVSGSPALQAVIVGITIAMIAFAGALAIVSLIKAVSAAMAILNTTMLANPFVLIAIAIVACGAALVYLYNHSEKFRNVCQKVFSAVKTVVTVFVNVWKRRINTAITVVKAVINAFNTLKAKATAIFSAIASVTKAKFDAVKNAITHPIETAKALVTGAINKIRSLFPIKLGNIFSGIKLPHFKITGGKIPWGIGGKGTAPSVSVQWYRKAMNNPMMLNRPTIFGYAKGSYLAGGEAGNEMIGGADTVSRMIEGAVNRGLSNMRLDVDGLAERIAGLVDRDITIELDKRAVGRLVRG